MKKLLLFAVLFSAISAQATLVRYGSATSSPETYFGTSWDATATGTDVGIGWSGTVRYQGVDAGVGTAGTFDQASAGATLTDDAVAGSGSLLTMTLLSITSGGAPSQSDSNNGGGVLGVVGGAEGLEINETESLSFSWNQDVRLKYMKVWNRGNNDYSMLDTAGRLSVAGGSDYTFTITGTSAHLGIDLGDVVVSAGTVLTLSTDSNGVTDAGWDPSAIVVETVGMSLSVTDRAGVDVTGQQLVNSDHMHLVVASDQPVVTYSYKFLSQTAEPTAGEWAATESLDFYKELYFFMEPVNQWVVISADDGVNAPIDEVVGLQAGVLTAPPDDPMSAINYVSGMGPGFIVGFDPTDPVRDMGRIKRGGFGHIRIHTHHSPTHNLDVETPEQYFSEYDVWIKHVLRHGLRIHLGNELGSGRGLEETDDGSPAWFALFLDEQVDHWSIVADYHKTTSHRLGYQFFLETGGGMSVARDSDRLNTIYSESTEVIRLVEPTRNLIYSPRSLNEVDALDELDFPYPDLNPGDGIPTGSGEYFFSDFHRHWAGPWRWITPEEIDQNMATLQTAVDWVAANNIPLILSANGYGAEMRDPIENRVDAMNQICGKLNESPIPIPITFLIVRDFIEAGVGWHAAELPMLEAMNQGTSIDIHDPDGDSISTEDEINIYGTDPYDCDTDNDGIVDTHECLNGDLDPLDPSDGNPVNDLSINADFDGDGMGNAWELLHSWDFAHQGYQSGMNYNDPSDALLNMELKNLAKDGLVNLWESVLVESPHSQISSEDLDDDGISNVDEIAAGTWFDSADRDFDGIAGAADLMPYVHDSNHVLSFTFDFPSGKYVLDMSTQGSDNSGAITGGNAVGGGLLDLTRGTGLVGVPTGGDLGSTSVRSVNLHCWPKVLGGRQILYKEGTPDSGMTIYLDGGSLWVGAWNQPNEQFIELGTLSDQEWYSVTLQFDGAGGTLQGTLVQSNARIANPKVPVAMALVGDDLGTVALGGSVDSTRVWNGSQSVIVSSGQNFNGYLDDVQIYNRLLSEVAVSRLSRNDLFPLKEPQIVDTDGDGVFDGADLWPSNPSEWMDTDLDGVGDNADTDDDNDGILDENDPYPISPLEFKTIPLLADTFVQKNNPTENRGDNDSLLMRAQANAFARIPLLKFDVDSKVGNLVGAKLKLYSSSADCPVDVYAVPDTSWDEMTVTWDTKPALGAKLTTVTASANNWFEIDLFSYVTSAGIYSVALDETADSVGELDSREGSHPPRLDLILARFEDTDGDGVYDHMDADDDNDGMSDANEIFAGFNPLDSRSFFEIKQFTAGPLQSYFQWASVSGRTYSVECSTNLESWLFLPGGESIFADDAETGFVDVTDMVEARFYRIKVLAE